MAIIHPSGWRELSALGAAQREIETLEQVTRQVEGHTICALGDAAAWPVQSFLKHFGHEFDYMIANGGKSLVQSASEAAA